MLMGLSLSNLTSKTQDFRRSGMEGIEEQQERWFDHLAVDGFISLCVYIVNVLVCKCVCVCMCIYVFMCVCL